MYRTIAAFLLTGFLAFLGDYTNSAVLEDNTGFEMSQPKPLILRDSTQDTVIIQPIVENIDMNKQYQYIRTIKVYYKDRMAKPIDLKKGPPVDGYCSDSTKLTFITTLNDTISRYSTKHLSCRILGVVNYTDQDINKLKKSPTKEIWIYNRVTENTYKYKVYTSYFQDVIP
jgi:hypothetical protein